MPAQTYAPTLEALNARPPPAWYDAAKFGIFVHWGMWAIPAFAAGTGSISDAFKADYDRAIAMTPYTEWYANAIKVPGAPSAEFHKAHYGDAPYETFKDPFLSGLKGWDAGAWAQAFREAGARYVVLVTKHHDGFCLWPSGVANPNRAGWDAGRDLVGEIAAAVRAEGLRFGVYYSGGIDWSFNPEPLLTMADFITSMPGGAYPAYAEAQVRELVARYEPSVLWNDIAWPTDQDALFRLFADYYAAIPEGVVNDRWVCPSPGAEAMRTPAMRRMIDDKIRARIARDPAAFEGVIPQEIPHSDFRTPEYARFPDIQAKKWEATRGMSHSFGFNRNDTEADYASAETLIGDFIDGVSKNGNLLLNVGPRADGAIPAEQLARLKAFGAWLGANGSAIYGARPWDRAEAVTDTGLPVRITRTDGAVNLIILGAPAGEALTIKGLALDGAAMRLADAVPARIEARGEDSVVAFTRPLTGAFAPVIRVETPAR
jgi:alpha-L-fucosidase